MATFHQIYSEPLSLLRLVYFLLTGVFLSIQLVSLSPVFAQTEDMVGNAPGIEPIVPPTPRLDSNLRYFGLSGESLDTRSLEVSEEGSLTPHVFSDTHSGKEEIAVMAETVVEGFPIDPFDDDPQVVIQDPWEPLNAGVFQFNYKVDQYFFKPMARGYNAILPPDVQVSLANAFDNMGFVTRLFNNLFQGKNVRAGIEMQRFLINTTIGIGGLFDVAKYAFAIEAPPAEDTGQTLAVYGFESGPYLVLPFLPPLTVRDAIGFAGDIALNPINYFIPFFPNLGLNAEKTLNNRARQLEFSKGTQESIVDLYGAVRSSYFSQRARDIQR